jgi:hypothetical protein
MDHYSLETVLHLARDQSLVSNPQCHRSAPVCEPNPQDHFPNLPATFLKQSPQLHHHSILPV